MPSRKRAKGRERKLKQQAREPVVRSVSQPPLNVRCYHGGFKHKTVRRHPAHDFIDSFIDTLTCGNFNVSVQNSLYMTFEEHQEVWKNSAVRKMTIDTMVSIGTDFLIDEYIEDARHLCIAIVLLEKYDGEGPFNSALSKAIEDFTYLYDAEERDIVRFYYKRIPCSCLNELYAKFKKCQVRGSICSHCKQTIKSKDLKTCSRCKFAQYCSKECQKLAWHSHKENCMKVAILHEKANKVKTTRSNEVI